MVVYLKNVIMCIALPVLDYHGLLLATNSPLIKAQNVFTKISPVQAACYIWWQQAR